MRVVSERAAVICEVLADKTRELAVRLARSKLTQQAEQTQRTAAAKKAKLEAGANAKRKKDAERQTIVAEQAASTQELLGLVKLAKDAEDAKDTTLALERYETAVRWGVSYLERVPSARSKLKPTMNAVMQSVKGLKAEVQRELDAQVLQQREQQQQQQQREQQQQQRRQQQQRQQTEALAAQQQPAQHQPANNRTEKLAAFLDGCRLAKYLPNDELLK